MPVPERSLGSTKAGFERYLVCADEAHTASPLSRSSQNTTRYVKSKVREASAQVGTDKMMELAEQPHQHIYELPTVKEQGPGPDSTPPPAQPVV